MRSSVSLASESEEEPSGLGPRSSEIIESLDFGVAVFDPDLKLLKANELYAELCGYDESLCAPGTSLETLIEASLQSRDLQPEEIKTSIATTMLRLRVGDIHKFRFQTTHGKYIAVTRRRNTSGDLIETVQELKGVDAQGEGTQQIHQMAELARLRMSYALEAMADGFALYDQDDRLVTYNQQYIELNPHIADLIKPGANYGEMLKKGVARGGFDMHDMEPDAFYEWRLQQHLNPGGDAYLAQLVDGRWMRSLDRKTDDGGIVCIRSDVTDMINQQNENARISSDLDLASNQLDEALNNMVQGLCMFDADRRLILCNRQYLKCTVSQLRS